MHLHKNLMLKYCKHNLSSKNIILMFMVEGLKWNVGQEKYKFSISNLTSVICCKMDFKNLVCNFLLEIISSTNINNFEVLA